MTRPSLGCGARTWLGASAEILGVYSEFPVVAGRHLGQPLEIALERRQILVADAASLFLVHPLDFTLVKPYVKGYIWTPIDVPLTRYLTIDPAGMK